MLRAALVSVAVAAASAAQTASAQEPPPPLPHVVVDLQGVIPVFPNDAQQLADSRGLNVTQLPGAGIGGRVGAHVYLFKYHGVTLGVGGELMTGRSSSSPDPLSGLAPADERLTTMQSELSLNFGTGHGWSYLSGGFGRSKWSLHQTGAPETSADTESLPTANYGGGARWFIKRHLAFSLDVRIYEIQPGGVSAFGAGSPRTRLLTFGAGISVK